jgi:tetratricopeptide (TPR) repeat protein
VIASGRTGILPESSISVYFPESQDGKDINEKDTVLREGTPYRVRVIDFDAIRDLAVLQVVTALPGDAQPLLLARKSCQRGDTVHSMGNPDGPVLWVYATGTVRAAYHKDWVEGGLRIARFQCVETAEPLWKGDSGSPVVDDRGELVAVNESIAAAAARQSFAIDVSEVRALLDEVRPLLHPKTAADYNRRGVRSMSRGRYGEAWSDFDQAIRRRQPGEDITEFLVNRARAYEERPSPNLAEAQADYDKAINDLNEALSSQPGKPELLIAQGRLFRKRKDPDSAKDAFEEALKSAVGKGVKPGILAEAYFHLYLLAPQGDRAREIEYLTKAIRLDPQNFVYHLHRGARYHDIGRLDRALTDTENSLTIAANELDPAKWWQIAPQLRIAYDNLGGDLAQMNRRDEAKQAFWRAFQAASHYCPPTRDVAEFNFNIGKKLLSLGAEDQAKEAFTAAKKISPPTEYRERALFFVNKSQENLVVYIKYRTLRPDGQWQWLPRDLASGDWGAPWKLKPGLSNYLISQGVRIHGDRIRLFIYNDKGEILSNRYQGEDLMLASEPYLGYVPERYVFTYPPP